MSRKPVTESLNLEAIGLDPKEQGFLETDHEGRTDVENVFAVGDITGEPMLAHQGFHEGELVAEVIDGEPSAIDYQDVPAAVFTDPEIGPVVMTKAETEEARSRPGKVPMSAFGRALTLSEADGFVRIVANEMTGFVLGGQIVSPEASEMIAEVVLAIEMNATLMDVGGTIHTNSTFAEATMEAIKNAQDHAIHTMN